MARPEKIALDVPVAVGTGAPANVFRFSDVAVQVYGPFKATVQIEATISGADYFPIGTALTTPGVVAIPFTVELIRARVTAFTSGQPLGVAAGLDRRAL